MIEYDDKVALNENSSVPEINKITADNMNEIKTVVNENDTRLTTVEAVIGNETDTYSASSTYALGDLVIYNSLLYKCTTAITVAEAWTMAHWTQVNLTSLVQSRDVNGTILWTNPNQTSSFSQQGITLSSDDYDELDWYFISDVANATPIIIKEVSKKGLGTQGFFSSNASLKWWARRIIKGSDTYYTIQDCNRVESSGINVDNGMIVPLYVVGRKIGLDL